MRHKQNARPVVRVQLLPRSCEVKYSKSLFHSVTRSQLAIENKLADIFMKHMLVRLGWGWSFDLLLSLVFGV